MADEVRRGSLAGPQEMLRKFKDIGVDGQGNTIFAPVLALEPGSIGGGGAGGGLTDAQLRAAAVLVDAGLVTVQGAVAVSNFPISQPVTGPLTDAQLRAADVAVTLAGEQVALDAATLAALEVIGLDAATLAALETIQVGNFPASQAVTGPLTDAQLRAAAVLITGALTDAQLRATPVVVDTKRGGAASWAWFSGLVAAPAASAVIADTGALAAGDYELHVHLASLDTIAVGKGMFVEHRNAANAATNARYGGVPAAGAVDIDIPRVTLAANERIRVIAGTAAGAAASQYVASIGRRLL